MAAEVERSDVTGIVEATATEIVVENSVGDLIGIAHSGTNVVVETETLTSVTHENEIELVIEHHRYSGTYAVSEVASIDDDVTLAYDAFGNLETLTFDYGEILTLTYGDDGLDQVTSDYETDPVATLSYTAGVLTRVVFGLD